MKGSPGNGSPSPRAATENRKEVKPPTRFLACPGCCGACCCTDELPLWIGRHILLHCCCTTVVGRSVGGRWVVGARGVVGARWVADRSLYEMAGGTNTPSFLPVKTRGPAKRSSRTGIGLMSYVLHCCTAACSRLLGG